MMKNTRKNRSYSQMMLFYLGAVVGVFVLAASIYEFRNEHNYKKAILATRLEGYADRLAYTDSTGIVQNVRFKENVRVTELSTDGYVMYDSENKELEINHSDRPEIRQCLKEKIGWAIRRSETDGREYCYLAKRYGDKIIRVALPYEVDIRHFMRPDTIYIIVGIVVLLIVLAGIGVALLRNYRALEKALRAVEDEKSENKRMKREMTHNIAHELRTPVSSMRGYLEAIIDCDDMEPERKRLFVQRAYLQSLRLSELLRDISLVTKIEESPELIKVEKFSLRDIVSGVLDEFSEKLAARQMEGSNMVPEETVLAGSPSLVYAIFRNLVENSCKYAGKGTKIEISARKQGNIVSVHYLDNGKGVAPQMLERIFERFFRIGVQSPEDYRDDVGSGLGLSVVKNAVRFHSGEISASIPDKGGLEFDFTLQDR